MDKININLDQRTIEQLKIEAAHQNASVSAVIRQACEHWLNRHARSSGVNTAQPGNPVWSLMREINRGYWIEDTAGNTVDFGHPENPSLSKRGTGSAGWQRCVLCGEMFDAAAGSYRDFRDTVYLCSLCGDHLLARQLP